MPYRDFLLALEADVARQQHELAAATELAVARMLDEARRAVADEEAAARASVDRELAAERERALREERRAAARALLIAQRQLLDGLRASAMARLRAGAGTDPLRLLALLLDEVVPLVAEGDGRVEVVVDPGAEAACRAHLAGAHPAVAARASVTQAVADRGGVEVRAGARLFDNTLPSRLAKAWPDLEPRLCALLFEGADAPR